MLADPVFVAEDTMYIIDSPSYIDQEQMDELFLESKAERKE